MRVNADSLLIRAAATSTSGTLNDLTTDLIMANNNNNNNQRSSILLEVYRCVQLKRWSVVCGCVLHRGQRGEGWCVSSTLCRYYIRIGLLLVRSWARVRRVSLGRESSEGEILGAC